MTDSTPNLPATVAQRPQGRPPRLWPLWLVAVLALAISLALALWSWQQWQAQQSLHQSLQQSTQHLSRDLEQLERRDNERTERIQSLQSRLNEQRELLARQQRQVDHNARELLEAGNRTRTDWLLAEAEYLLRIANQRLQIEKDIKGALAALRAADDVLRESDDIGVYPVREELAREILALRSVTDIDRTGLYLQLEAARDSVTRITDQALVREQAPGFTAEATTTEPAAADGTLTRAWETVRESLRNVVEIRRLDAPAKPLLSPDQSAWARLNLQLMLEQAELAVLRGHPELYQQALAKAIEALETWYDSSNQRIVALRDTLEELKGRDIDPVLPDISDSLELLKRRIAGRHQDRDADTDSGKNTDAES